MDANEIPVIKFFAEIIKNELGIIYNEQNYYQLKLRLIEICKYFEVESIFKLKDLKGITTKNSLQQQMLLDIATNNETQFFRDTNVFKGLEKVIIPEIIEKKSNAEPLKIWSIACSFGQEPYTICMLYDQLKIKKPGCPPLKVLASDISKKALKKAQNGLYTQLEVQRGLPIFLLTKYFTKDDGNQWKINSQIQSLVSFKEINILNLGSTFSEVYDIIFLRNVLIYQDVEKKREIIKNAVKHLSKDGYLILGASESMIGIMSDYSQKSAEGAIFYQFEKK